VINHQCWLLEIRDGRRDLYPEIKQRVSEAMQRDISETLGRLAAIFNCPMCPSCVFSLDQTHWESS